MQPETKYDHLAIEERWQKKWLEDKIYQPDFASAPRPYYNLMMFPYPSAEGMHVGNMYAQTGGDIHGRFKRMQGYDVFQPMGLDGFGIHSENYALKVGSHPMDQAQKSEENFYRQMRQTGSGFAWDNTVETWKEDYYRWTQWVFIQLFKAGLAYRAAVAVNFCPSCKTVLADEQVIDGRCERCNSEVEKKDLEQWMFRITTYAEQLLEGLDRIDWTEKVKTAQRNWIGKSEGAQIEFAIQSSEVSIKVFTTRPDTLYGATFLVVSPEHPAVKEWVGHPGVREYLDQSTSRSDADRIANKDKTGVFSGAFALNPINSQQIPIWIADYVLMGYGTGAIMAVPAHDERDFEFAKKYDLQITYVVEPKFATRTGDSAVKEGEQFIKRNAVCAIVRNPKDDTYLCVSWKDFHMNGLVTGGVEEGEDLIEAGLREIHEETGYKNVRLVKDTGVTIHSLFYHRQKKQNRWARFHYVMYELVDEDRDPISGEEEIKMDILWKSKSELKDFFSVVEGEYLLNMINDSQAAFIGDGIIGNSGDWDGLSVSEAKKKAIEDLERLGAGEKKITYHLRDWLISRQRYWGPPIPMIYCESCAKEGKSWFSSEAGKKGKTVHSDHGSESAGWYPSEDLPVVLPRIDDYKPIGTHSAGSGQAAVTSPLGNHPEFYETTCPECGGSARRETDVSDTFLDSSWYFYRYFSIDDNAHAWTPSLEQKWMPVTIYTGGAEHSVLHLLYSRFVTKAFQDAGLISDYDEPFPRFFAHGLIVKDGAKMSKSKGNVIVPDAYIKKFGADTLRTYLMFLGPFDAGGDFRDSGIEGMNRFIKRVWTLLSGQIVPGTVRDNTAKSEMHTAIKGVTHDLETFHYNTAIAKIMTYYNFLSKKEEGVYLDEAQVLLQLLAPFAPHMTEELWQILATGSIHVSGWPQFDPHAIQAVQIVVAVQVNGKLRSTFVIHNASLSQEEVEKLAREQESVQKHLAGRTVRKVVYVPGKILNFVVA